MNTDTPIFINPDGSNKSEVTQTFNNATTLLIDFLSSAEQKPLLPTAEQVQSFSFELPEKALTDADMKKELNKVLASSMNPANPSYIGHMDSLPTTYSIIGSLFSSALNNNLFSLEMSPYFTRLEYSLLKQFASLFGLPHMASGIIMSGGTLSNIQAIITARNYALKSKDGDLSKSKQRLVFFASEHAHISVKKAAMISGLGIDSLIYVKADVNGKMNVQDLRTKIDASKKSGHLPFAVVATVGTTVTGNIDPIEEIGTICRAEQLWFHADAIYGGALILSNKEKHRLNGIENADSISFNPQKWMHISKTCSLLMFRDAEILKEYFSMKATYTKDQNEFVNLSELSIQGTKHAEVLKLWLSMLSIGLSGYEKLIDDSMIITETFIRKLKQISNIEFASEAEMNIPTFRLKAETDEQSNILNKQFNEFAIKEYNLFFSLPTYVGKLWQRTILLNPFIDEKILDKVVTAIQAFNRKHNLKNYKQSV